MLSHSMIIFANKATEEDELFYKLIKKVQKTSGNYITDFHYVILITSVLGISHPLKATQEIKDGQICIDKLQECLSNKLSERQLSAITLRYGIPSGSLKTLRSVGTQMNCCAENVRVLEHAGIRKLRNFHKSFLLD